MLVLMQLINLVSNAGLEYSNVFNLNSLESRLDQVTGIWDLEELIEDIQDFLDVDIELTESHYERLYKVVKNGTYKAAFKIAS